MKILLNCVVLLCLLAIEIMAKRHHGHISKSVFERLAELDLKDMERPAAKPMSDLIGNDPEETMNVPETIVYHGYPFQKVKVETQDGYILEMHRIPFGRNSANKWNDEKRPVVFLQHGLLGSSSNWVSNLPNQSAAFVFADAGFDVWMGNVRGNTYGKEHAILDPSDDRFWTFSWDEMALYDLPAMVDKVREMTQTDKIYYVGHSQGTMIMFSKLAHDPDFGREKIERFFALAPVATVKHIRGVFRFIADKFGDDFTLFTRLFGSREFLPGGRIMSAMSRMFCANENPLCDNFLFLASGPDSQQLNQTRLPVYLGSSPSGTSTQNIVHWIQMVNSGKQQMFDYGGKIENIKRYGKPYPPEFDISRINTPTHLYWSDYDWLADESDVTGHLLEKIPEEYLHDERLYRFNHMDFIWGLNAPREVYEPIIETIRQDIIRKNGE